MDTARKVGLLRVCPLFEHLSSDDITRLADRATVRHYRHGQTVFFAGDPGDSLLVVVEGWLKVLSRSEDGDDLLLGLVGPPESIGALAIADGGPRSATVEALTDSVVLRVSRGEIMRVSQSSPSVSEALVRMLSQVVRRLTGTAADLVFLDLPHRLAKLLVSQPVAGTGGTSTIATPWTQTDMARAIGASRQSVNAALGDFQRRGWIRLEGNSLSIVDPAALSRFAGA